MATAISFPSGETLTSPSPPVAIVGTSWSTGVRSRVPPSARVTVNRCWRLLARRAARHVGEPNARDAAIVLEGVLGDRIRDPLPVGRELRVAHRLEREIVVDGQRALLGGQNGKP